jgi:hypothetical protein
MITMGLCILIGCSASFLLLQANTDTIRNSARTVLCVFVSFFLKISLNVDLKKFQYLSDWNLMKHGYYGDSTRLFALYRHHVLDSKWHDNMISEESLDDRSEYMFYEGQFVHHMAKCHLSKCPCQFFKKKHACIRDDLSDDESKSDKVLQRNPDNKPTGCHEHKVLTGKARLKMLH